MWGVDKWRARTGLMRMSDGSEEQWRQATKGAEESAAGREALTHTSGAHGLDRAHRVVAGRTNVGVAVY